MFERKKEGKKERRTDRKKERKKERMNQRTNERTDGRTDRRVDGWTTESLLTRIVDESCFVCRRSVQKYLSHVMRKPTFCICENKDGDQLRGDREADQRLCFRYIDSTIPLFSKSEISSL